ncbi:DUF2510 domain-containing protein [Microbacterium sp. NPDC087591]|uniref:DUF2510 domain-containing protein n=1 Tax=Microbacterium sp. NPDC087591 TaxID=3364192 RepID=UPI00381156CD
MTTPAGWYDDGSGRQRWWDGQQWTEHFAPEAAAPEAESAAADVPAADASAYEAPAAEEPSIDDTVIRPTDEAAVTPAAQDSSVPPETPLGSSDPATFADQSATAATTPLDDGAAYAAPAAPIYPAAAPGQPATGYPGSAPAYPGSAPAYPGAFTADPTGYPAAAPYGQVSPEGPKKISVLGLVGLGLGALGTILVFIPVIGFIGFILLAAGFIVSLVSLFLKGKKWPGITGLVLAVVGTIIGIVMSFVYLFAFAQGVSSEIDNLPSSSPSVEATEPGETAVPDDGADTGTRPTADEVAVGLAAIIGATPGADGYTDAQISCIAEVFVASDLDDDTLRVIAESDGTLTDLDAATGVAEVFGDTEAITACFVG